MCSLIQSHDYAFEDAVSIPVFDQHNIDLQIENTGYILRILPYHFKKCHENLSCSWLCAPTRTGIPEQVRDAVQAAQEAFRVVEAWRAEAASASTSEAEAAAADSELRASLAEAGVEAQAERPKRGEVGEEECLREESGASQQLGESKTEHNAVRSRSPVRRARPPSSAHGVAPYG